MNVDPLIGSWRKVAVNGYPLTDGIEVLHLRADGTAENEGEWQGEPFGCRYHWSRVNASHWQLHALIPAGALPGQTEDVVLPGLLHEVLELTADRMKTSMRPGEVAREQARQMLVQQGHLRPDEPMPPDDVYDYERIPEPYVVDEAAGDR